ncbi:hypothetical protein B6U99_05680 [Candidatus Geothermarchaeota archaeon ex4572_27]|nr:MAG: hypothetical protein B6U99_05680 [Candidatus Geothermarchaeota archaeon ex4572_27]
MVRKDRDLHHNYNYFKKPLHTLIYSIIKNKGNILFSELMRSIREVVEDVSESEVRKALLKLEIWGFISVETEGDDSRIILRRG